METREGFIFRLLAANDTFGQRGNCEIVAKSGPAGEPSFSFIIMVRKRQRWLSQCGDVRSPPEEGTERPPGAALGLVAVERSSCKLRTGTQRLSMAPRTVLMSRMAKLSPGEGIFATDNLWQIRTDTVPTQ
ncbi:hypothetical protein THTE_2926 [Thermogutta terrifontis]|uniref:Uncharacterized protein n=1 Tax=Thermogutta terrifontis TaxID=1331910 RepID=A0A286RHT9_9BACT|nr:hypothetical protein THTE_2926 [Thermogutta terrifontis]